MLIEREVRFLNLEQLIYIVQIAKSKSLISASKSLHVSQSALSQAVTRLEEELGMKLFERTRNGAIPTKESLPIILKAEEALEAIHLMKKEAQYQQSNLTEIIKIASIPGLTGPIIDTLLAFRENEQLLKIEMNEKGSYKIIEDIENGKIDIGFIALNRNQPMLKSDMEFIPVISGKMILMVSSKSPLVGEKIVSKEQFEQLSFVLYKDEHVQEFINDYQLQNGPIDVVFQATNSESFFKALTQHDFATIGHECSTLFNPLHNNGEIASLEIEGYTDYFYTFGWTYNVDYKISNKVKQFINQINTKLLAGQKDHI